MNMRITNDYDICKIYGISQSPNTNDYIIIQDVYIASGNGKIDSFIQQMRLQRSSHNDIIFEWIPYNQFNNIKEISKGDSASVYSAVWKDGPLHYYKKKVILKCINNLQNITDEYL